MKSKKRCPCVGRVVNQINTVSNKIFLGVLSADRLPAGAADSIELEREQAHPVKSLFALRNVIRVRNIDLLLMTSDP